MRYVPSGVWRLLSRMGWSNQRVQSLAIQRNEDAIENWKVHQLPRIKKRCELKAWLDLEDESGFSLVSSLRSSWAPRGQTPCTYTSLNIIND